MDSGRTLTCRWCPKLATGTVRGLGWPGHAPTGEISHCEDHWDAAYEIARRYPERHWRYVEPPDTLF